MELRKLEFDNFRPVCMKRANILVATEQKRALFCMSLLKNVGTFWNIYSDFLAYFLTPNRLHCGDDDAPLSLQQQEHRQQQ